MDKLTLAVMGEQIGEGLLGGAIAIVADKTICPKCNNIEKVIVGLGTSVVAWTVGRAFAKTYYKWCAAVDEENEEFYKEIAGNL